VTQDEALEHLLVGAKRLPPHARRLGLTPEATLMVVRALVLRRPEINAEELHNGLREVGVPTDTWTRAAVWTLGDVYKPRESRRLRFVRRDGLRGERAS